MVAMVIRSGLRGWATQVITQGPHTDHRKQGPQMDYFVIKKVYTDCLDKKLSLQWYTVNL